jgi:hypothetical protein
MAKDPAKIKVIESVKHLVVMDLLSATFAFFTTGT